MDKRKNDQWPFPEDEAEMERLARSLGGEGDDLWAEFQAALEKGRSLRPDEIRMTHYRRMTGQEAPEKHHYTRQHRRRNGLCRITVAILALFLIGTVLVTSVDALRARVVSFFVETFDQFSSINFIRPEEGYQFDPADTMALNEPFDPLAQLLPEGYWLQEGIALRKNVKFATYVNDADGFISYDIHRASGTSNFDSENAEIVEETEIGGHRAIFVKKNGYLLVWFNDESLTCHSLFANALELEQFMHIAEALADAESL